MPVNIGTDPNDGTGDPLRTAFGKVNTDAEAMRLALRDAGVLPLSNVGGTGDAITAQLLPSLHEAGVTTLSAVSQVEYVPVATNTVANPTLTIGGATYPVRDADGDNWPANGFVVGRSYILRRRNTILRVITGRDLLNGIVWHTSDSNLATQTPALGTSQISVEKASVTKAR